MNLSNFELLGDDIRESSLTQQQRKQIQQQREMIELLEQLYRITPDTELSPMEFLFRLFDEPCFPRGELVALTGRAKSGKTFILSIIMTMIAVAELLNFKRETESRLKVLWYDTEQSKQSTKGILTERVKKLVKGDFPEENFFVFNVRACTYEERLELLITGIQTYKPDMVIIDNISDLLPSVNDSEQSSKIIEQLMVLSTEYDCNITVVIHLNRSGEKRNLRGWLGTEILHKAYEVYYCEQIADADVFFVQQTLTRKYHIKEHFYYKFDEEGVPVSCEKPDYQTRNTDDRFLSNKSEAYQISQEKAGTFNQRYIIRHEGNTRQPWEWNLRLLFNEAMGPVAEMAPEGLRDKVMKIAGIQQPKYYDKVLTLATEKRIVKTTIAKNGRVVVIPIPS